MSSSSSSSPVSGGVGGCETPLPLIAPGMRYRSASGSSSSAIMVVKLISSSSSSITPACTTDSIPCSSSSSSSSGMSLRKSALRSSASSCGLVRTFVFSGESADRLAN
eukprot:scaffold20104_cov120-Isochrysis_galbana.AAC.6